MNFKITKSRAYCGSVMRPANEFEGTFLVDGIAQSLDQVARHIAAIPDLLEALERFTHTAVEDCAHCNEQSWYGVEHTSDCPVTEAKALILKLSQDGKNETL
jgi:hypothetical protein